MERQIQYATSSGEASIAIGRLVKAGCEVLAISNWLLRRDDQVGCVVFSPIDAAEARLTRGSVTS